MSRHRLIVGRASGALASIEATNVPSRGGTVGTRSSNPGGGVWTWWSTSSSGSVDVKGGRPESSSKRMQPSAYTSAWAVTCGASVHCSGAMYAAVPSTL